MSEQLTLPKKNLSVALVTPGWPARMMANGIVSYTACLARALQRLSVRCFVLTSRLLGDGDGNLVRCLPRFSATSWPGRAAGRILDRIHPDYWRAKSFSSILLEEVRRLNETKGLDIIELEESFGWAQWLAKASPVPVVVRLHGPWFLNGPANGVPNDASFQRRIRYEGRGIRLATAVSAPSKYVLDKTRSYFELALADAQVIPNPVDRIDAQALWRVDSCERDRILFVGRFDRGKGGDVVIDAFSRLIRDFPSARLDFVGVDSGLSDDQGKRWGIAEFINARLAPTDRAKVRYLGFRPGEEIVELRRRSLLTIVGSRYETFPMTALEAMAMGCPLIASDAGGLVEIIQDGRNGLRCRGGDPEDLANKMLRLLKDPALAERLGRQAAADCQARYNPQLVAQQTLDFYRRVVERFPRH